MHVHTVAVQLKGELFEAFQGVVCLATYLKDKAALETLPKSHMASTSCFFPSSFFSFFVFSFSNDKHVCVLKSTVCLFSSSVYSSDIFLFSVKSDPSIFLFVADIMVLSVFLILFWGGMGEGKGKGKGKERKRREGKGRGAGVGCYGFGRTRS